MNNLPSVVKVKEVGPRDGLQAEATILATEDKLRLIHSLTNTGVAEIEASSFVSPKAIPLLADAAEAFARLQHGTNTVYSAIVPNEKGAHRAVEADADEIQILPIYIILTTSATKTSGSLKVLPGLIADRSSGKGERAVGGRYASGRY